MIFPFVAFLAAYVQGGLTLDRPLEEVKSVCGDNAILKCTAKCIPGVKYWKLRWYKLSEDSGKISGLLLKSLSPNSTTKYYDDLQREVRPLADDSLDIVLPNVTAIDSGRYKCLLVAPVGELNQDGKVQLTVTGCLKKKSIDTILILSIVGLVVALLIFFMSYIILRNMLLQRSKKTPVEPLLDTRLEKKVLKLIYTMGTNSSGQSFRKHIYV